MPDNSQTRYQHKLQLTMIMHLRCVTVSLRCFLFHWKYFVEPFVYYPGCLQMNCHWLRRLSAKQNLNVFLLHFRPVWNYIWGSESTDMAESLNYFQFAKGEEGDFVKWRCHIMQMVTKWHFVIALSSPAVPLCSVTRHPRDENGLFIVFSHKVSAGQQLSLQF